MGIRTGIQYADSTINSVMGCTGCELYDPDVSKSHCYAHKMTHHYAGRRGWPERFEEPKHFPKRLETAALAWLDLTGTERPGKPWLDGMPRVVFVNDMSDGFCPHGVSPSTWLLPNLDMMRNSPHIWLILTKWPNRMASFFLSSGATCPPNVWLGTSVTGPGTMWRLDALLRIKKRDSREIRFVSFEPLLESIDPREYMRVKWGVGQPIGEIEGVRCPPGMEHLRPARIERYPLDWIIWGGESGMNARMPPFGTFGDLPVLCNIYDVPGFFKQWGGFHHEGWVTGGHLFCDENIRPEERQMPLWSDG